MGTKHFDQMYADAMARDCRAALLFLSLVATSQMDKRYWGYSFWESTSVDGIMDIARRLLPLGDKFLTDVKRLLLEGRVDIYGLDRHGKLRRITDPDVVDFDEVSACPSAFIDMMMTISDEFCSGDQNAYGPGPSNC